MQDLTSSLQALSTSDAGSDGSKSKLTDVDNPTTARPSLETLPVELQRLIIATDFRSLSALVHASPQLHRVYAEHRTSVLRDVVTQTLAKIEADALGAYRSGAGQFQQIHNESLLWAFVEEQQARYSGIPLLPGGDWTAELSLDEIIQILRFHISVIEPLTEAFAHWSLGALPSKPENEAACKSIILSDTERCRIQRSLYRMQMFCNVCFLEGRGTSWVGDTEKAVEHLRMLSIFPAWEVEEILSVNEFAEDKYASVFRQVAWDLNEERNPKYKHISLPDVNDLMLLVHETIDGEEVLNELSLRAVLRHGPRLLADMFKQKSQAQLAETIRATIESSPRHYWDRYFLDWSDESIAHMERREEWPNRYDYAQDRRQKMIFNGDQLDSPPLAWILFWHGEYSNLLGMFIPKALRRWGYVMWDAARLDPDAKDAVVRGYYEKHYHLSDPREDDYDSSVAGTPPSW